MEGRKEGRDEREKRMLKGKREGKGRQERGQ